MNEGHKLILDYHRAIMEKDPIAGQELIRLNAKHLEKCMEDDIKKRQVPISAVRSLKKNKKKKRR